MRVQAAINGPIVDTGDKAVIISERGVADADESDFSGNNTVHVGADIVVTVTCSYGGSACVTHNHVAKARGDTIPGVVTQSRVTISGVVEKRVITDACVTEARYVVPQGPITERVVLVAFLIVRKRCMSNGIVVATTHITKEREGADSVVVLTGVVIIKRLKTDGCVIVIIGPVKERPGTDGRILNASPVVKEPVPSDGRVIVGIVERKRSIPNPGVSVANYIAGECAKSGGYVFGASGIDKKCLGTVGRALVAADIAEERFIADRGVLVANGVTKERFETNGHVPDSASEAEESVSALCRVLVSIASVRWWVNRSRYGRKT